MTQQPAPATPPATPQPRPGTPWPDPPTLPRGPRYTPTAAQRIDARRTLARYQGDLDRQANAALGVTLAQVGMLADHLEHHPECDGACEALVTHVRSLVAMRDAFDAVAAQRRGIAVNLPRWPYRKEAA